MMTPLQPEMMITVRTGATTAVSGGIKGDCERCEDGAGTSLDLQGSSP